MLSSLGSVMMAPSTPTKGPKSSESRPTTLRTTKSFPRTQNQEPTDTMPRTRASTVGSDPPPEITIDQHLSPKKDQHPREPDAPDTFESETSEETIEPPRASVDLDDIPIELVSKVDNFIDSLSAKVHSTPPNIDNLSQMFQNFYNTAASHIQTHVASMATRQSREGSSSTTSLSKASAASILRAKAVSLGTGSKEKAKGAPTKEPEQQMLTAEEFADRKRARRALEQQKALLEEAIERRLCEGIYDRIYRHRTTQDEAQDDRLRSKTAALAVVGIGPIDLGVNLGESPEDDAETLEKKRDAIYNHLGQARKDLILMNEKRYPLGKLNCLKAAHRSIVDTLSHFHPSSSADEIMPMLIYLLITMPPEKLNVISDSKFIERFRWEEKMDGEAAYCLTNLEAAITFLDTVDLASLRADEQLSGPPKGESQPGTPKTETFPPAYVAGGANTAQSPSASAGSGVAPNSKSNSSPAALKTAAQLRNRRLSDLMQTPAQAIGNASDFFSNTADQGFKSISNSLGDSYKFLLGKIRDTSAEGKEVVVPRTLDDARKLVSTPPPDEDGSVDGSNSAGGDDRDPSASRAEDRMLSLVGGKKASRDHSADSNRSARSASGSKKVAFAEESREKSPSPAPTATASNPALVESMRNLGNSINPLNRLSGISMIRGFGRTTGATPPLPPKDVAGKTTEGGDLGTAFPDIAGALPPKTTPKINPPNKRFMELQNPADLRLGEVLDLLRDYRRLAGALKEMGAFKE